jgi:hypothetical protein
MSYHKLTRARSRLCKSRIATTSSAGTSRNLRSIIAASQVVGSLVVIDIMKINATRTNSMEIIDIDDCNVVRL